MGDDSILAAIAALRVAMLERFDRMENRLGLIRDDISVNMNRVDHVERTGVTAVREELRSLTEIVTTLIQKQRKVEAQLFDMTKPQ